MWELVFLLLPIAAYSGYWVARKTATRQSLPRDYFLGLEHLLHSRTEKAVIAFSRMLDYVPESVESHLALGAVLRRKGDLSRAISIHHALLSRPNLEAEQKERILFALAEDYWHAGILDKAEAVLEELSSLDGDFATKANWYLLAIYEQERDWQKAMDLALSMEDDVSRPRSLAIGHYLCELAEIHKQSGQYEKARMILADALSIDRNCARASILLGECCIRTKDYHEAIRSLKKVEKQDPALLPEALGNLAHSYAQLSANEALLHYLEGLLARNPSPPLLMLYAKYAKTHYGEAKTVELIIAHLKTNPSIRGLGLVVAYHLRRAPPYAQNQLLLLQSLMEKLLAKEPLYRCRQCGYTGKLLHWQCPCCRKWASIKPIEGLEGEAG